jgi:hypothetical protein
MPSAVSRGCIEPKHRILDIELRRPARKGSPAPNAPLALWNWVKKRNGRERPATHFTLTDTFITKIRLLSLSTRFSLVSLKK